MALDSQAGRRTALVTGATGFIGRALCKQLVKNGWWVRVISRHRHPDSEHLVDWIELDLNAVANDSGKSAFESALKTASAGVDTVFHLAAMVHQTNVSASEYVYDIVNHQASVALARAALLANVRHFVFVSSIKVLGEATEEAPFTPESAPHPTDPYSRSKLAAEQKLIELCKPSAMGLTIVRPPLVYGPLVRANLNQLMGWIESGLPLPLSSVSNRRSMIGLTNLGDLLANFAVLPQADQRVLLPADVHFSTPELVRAIAKAMGKTATLYKVPVGLLRLAKSLPVIGPKVARLTGSLVVHDRFLNDVLRFEPRHSPHEEIAEMVKAWRSQPE